MDRKLIGNIGEAKAKLFFIEGGYDIFTPETINACIDFIIYKDGICKTVEVKSTNKENGEIKLQTCYTTTKNHIAVNFIADADYLVIYNHKTNELKVLNAKDYQGRSTVRIKTVESIL